MTRGALPDVRVITEAEIRELVTYPDALEATRAAFVAFAHGQAIMPQPMEFDLAQRNGEIHVKGAYISTLKYFAVKVASGFYRNREVGLPSSSGFVAAFDSETGCPSAILLDNGWLTDMRTAAAGALAAQLLSRVDAETVAMVGTGAQARYQLKALSGVRNLRTVRVFGRSPERADSYCRQMSELLGIRVSRMATVQSAVFEADVIVTTTPAREPLLFERWVAPGTHVTAVGSDLPAKCELEPFLLGRADLVVADSVDQCVASGEIHHAVQANVLEVGTVVELGVVAALEHPGRTSADSRTIADLTGLGVQDAALANLVVTRALG